MKAYVFPGQGAQFSGMGKDLYESNAKAKELFDKANDILGFNITKIMFEGTDEELRQTKVTQPAVFLHSVISTLAMDNLEKPDMVAGHSLGEFSALVVSGVLSFECGLRLVYKRAIAMQKACEETSSTMAAIIGLSDEKVEELCSSIEGVVPANFNSPGQIVVSGLSEDIDKICVLANEAGAKKAIKLNVGGGFHSHYMEPARVVLAEAIEATNFAKPFCPIYQNVDAKPNMDPVSIKKNLVAQLTSPVRWTKTVQNMIADGATEFTEIGPGKVLRGLIRRIDRSVEAKGL